MANVIYAIDSAREHHWCGTIVCFSRVRISAAKTATFTTFRVRANIQHQELVKATILREIIIGDPTSEEQRDNLQNIVTHCPGAHWPEDAVVFDAVLRGADE